MHGQDQWFRTLAILSVSLMLAFVAVAGAEEMEAHHHASHSHDIHSASTWSTAQTIASTMLSNATVGFVCCSYTPNTVTIETGESVTWNGDFQFHPLAQVEGPEDDTETPGGFAHSTGTTYTHTFDTQGTYYYACLFHGTFGGTMRGQVNVVASTSVPGGVDARALRLTVAPNPVFTTATASFALPRAMNTDVTVYALSGARVSTIQHGALPTGNQRVAWNGKDSAGNTVGSGIYFIRLTGEGFRLQAKLVKIR